MYFLSQTVKQLYKPFQTKCTWPKNSGDTAALQKILKNVKVLRRGGMAYVLATCSNMHAGQYELLGPRFTCKKQHMQTTHTLKSLATIGYQSNISGDGLQII